MAKRKAFCWLLESRDELRHLTGRHVGYYACGDSVQRIVERHGAFEFFLPLDACWRCLVAVRVCSESQIARIARGVGDVERGRGEAGAGEESAQISG